MSSTNNKLICSDVTGDFYKSEVITLLAALNGTESWLAGGDRQLSAQWENLEPFNENSAC